MGIVKQGLDPALGDDPAISKVGQEQVRTMSHFQPRMAVVWAVAPTEVAVKSRKQLVVQLTQLHAVPMGPKDEVFCRSKVSAGSNGGVSSLR